MNKKPCLGLNMDIYFKLRYWYL